MNATTVHRLEGLEPDNLLAFLALLGLLQAIECEDRQHAEGDRLCPRAAWDVSKPPLHPILFLARPVSQDEVCEYAAAGVKVLSEAHDFDGRKDLNYSQHDCRLQLRQAAESSSFVERNRADLLAALMSDVVIKNDKTASVQPTQLCLLFGQGHQHFLERLASVPRQPAPPARGKGKKAITLTEPECLAETLFQPWRRIDPTFSFRWDPDEDVRYALMAGDPTDPAYKNGTQHGANRLGAIGLGAITAVPQQRFGRVRLSVVGGAFDSDGFLFSWPIWSVPAALATVRALLAHPDLRRANALKHLSVHHTMTARRISVGKFMNFGRANVAQSNRY